MSTSSAWEGVQNRGKFGRPSDPEHTLSAPGTTPGATGLALHLIERQSSFSEVGPRRRHARWAKTMEELVLYNPHCAAARV